jgi:Uma2 family endonuclease
VEQPRQTGFNADEFIAWALEQPSGRFELSNGVVVAMAPERAGDNQAKLNAAIALRAGIAAKSLPCRAMIGGMAVRVNERTVYEPDALVRCGPPLPPDVVEVRDPVIVVEVVSPSSRGIDRGAKLVAYFEVPSVRHYLIVDSEAQVVIHHRRDETGAIRVEVVREGSLTLDPPGLAIEVRGIFEGV